MSRVFEQLVAISSIDQAQVTVIKVVIDETEISETIVGGITFINYPSLSFYYSFDLHLLQSYIDRFNPKQIFVHGSILLVRKLLSQLQAFRAGREIILYLPIEGNPIANTFIELLVHTDKCIVYTEFHKNKLEALGKQYCGHKTLGQIHVLFHSVDYGSFYPLMNEHCLRRAFARKLFFGDDQYTDRFIVLNANKSGDRKSLDVTIKGFVAFAKERPDTLLILHSDIPENDHENDLIKLINESGLSCQILMSSIKKNALSVEQLNLLYNACDVGINTAMGEGWGLTSFEHAAVKCAQIIPAHTTFIENWKGAGVFVNCSNPVEIFYEGTEMYPPDPRSVTEQLSKLYSEPDFYHAMSEKAFEVANHPQINKEAFKNRFIAILNN